MAAEISIENMGSLSYLLVLAPVQPRGDRDFAKIHKIFSAAATPCWGITYDDRFDEFLESFAKK
ncbi:MAG: hypothetical protein R3B84_09130 [Zavarzinella sp.]